MMKKREFLRTLGLAGAAIPLSGIAERFNTNRNAFFPDPGLDDDAFWKEVRNMYPLNPEYINLENGYYNILPLPVLETQIRHMRELNRQGSRYMRTKMESEKEENRRRLAEFLSCPVEEVIMTRNTTESLDTVISGIDWKKGDEAIMAHQEYGAMLDMFRQQARRYGMVNRTIDIPLNPAGDDEITEAYRKAISPRTRLILVSHMINITGQIMPVRKICDMAHERGIEVVVDGAHAIGHFEFDIRELNCDYYGASLHKWLSMPLGAGLLWIRREKIAKLWPLFGESAYPEDDIRKLNHTGTGPVHVGMTLGASLDFLKAIGLKRKENRLRSLQRLWSDEVRQLKGIRMNTPSDPSRSCAIANVGIEGMDPQTMAEKLLKEHGIWTVAINSAGVQGCRITPNVFNSESEMEKLSTALKILSGN